MKKLSLIARAQMIPGFTEFHERIVQSIVIAGKSQSLVKSYERHLAMAALRFGCVPTEVPLEDIQRYLYEVKIQFPTASEAYFKFTVYSLRYAYKLQGMTHMHLAMPSIKHQKKLPVVLSKPEMRKMLETPKWLKHRLLLSLLYGCGLRCMEVRNLRLVDLDFDRKMLHVRQGKGKRDRYVPLAQNLMTLLEEYIGKNRPKDYLFHGKSNRNVFYSKYSQRGIQWIVRQVATKAGIQKPVSVHTLRHTFATHLLEDGLDIVSIKELLGHSRIETTMVYLHVVQPERKRVFSPLDTLYGARPVTGNVAQPHAFVCPALKLLDAHKHAALSIQNLKETHEMV